MAIAESTVAILVDFDNFFINKDLAGNTDWLAHEIDQMISMALAIDGAAKNIFIRLYGGWLENGALTTRASQVQMAATNANPFPFPHPNPGAGSLRGSVDLVTRLYSIPEHEFAHTSKTKVGLPRLKLISKPNPAECLDATACPIKTLHAMTKSKYKKCPATDCTVTSDKAFIRTEQKMVDTLMACDMQLLLKDQSVSAILVLSDDIDIIPAAITASVLFERRPAPKIKIFCAIPNSDVNHPYKDMLNSLGMQICCWRS